MMHVLFFISGMLITAGILLQAEFMGSVWAILVIPGLIAVGTAVFIDEYNKDLERINSKK